MAKDSRIEAFERDSIEARMREKIRSVIEVLVDEERQSEAIPRYQRRTSRVDEAILGLYLSGANTRRIRGALAPLLSRFSTTRQTRRQFVSW
jgi:transposase-like protein